MCNVYNVYVNQYSLSVDPDIELYFYLSPTDAISIVPGSPSTPPSLHH